MYPENKAMSSDSTDLLKVSFTSCVGSALKQIEITQVQAWFLLRKFGIEMVGHRFPPCQCPIDYSRLYRRCAIFEARKCLNGAAQLIAQADES